MKKKTLLLAFILFNGCSTPKVVIPPKQITIVKTCPKIPILHIVYPKLETRDIKVEILGEYVHKLTANDFGYIVNKLLAYRKRDTLRDKELAHYKEAIRRNNKLCGRDNENSVRK